MQKSRSSDQTSSIRSRRGARQPRSARPKIHTTGGQLPGSADPLSRRHIRLDATLWLVQPIAVAHAGSIPGGTGGVRVMVWLTETRPRECDVLDRSLS
jgi:hypothetical protein